MMGEEIRQGDVVYVSLWLRDPERAAAFFGHVLGWTYAPASVGRAQLVEGVTPHQGLMGSGDDGTLFLCYAVDDLAATLERVRAAGGEVDASQTTPDGQTANCVDDQGTRFAVYQPPTGGRGARGPTNGLRHGDLAYVALEVRDSGRARAFYGAVLGWRFTPGRIDDGWGVDDVVPMLGLHGGHERATGLPMYRVDDIQAAVSRIRAAGGTASDPERQPYGLTSDCTDDQGTRFYLGQM